MLCIKMVSLTWCLLVAVGSADFRKPGSCSMSHSRASGILRHTLASAYLEAVGYLGNGLWKG